jgi:cytosine/creatinine deaminase
MPQKKLKYFDLKSHILNLIRKNGGWANVHSHMDRSYTVTRENFHLYESPISVKWGLVDEMKRNSTVSDIYDRMAKVVEVMVKQGETSLG